MTIRWQPIEEAPKHTLVLVCVSGYPNSVWLAEDIGKRKQIWVRKGEGRLSRLYMVPTHWAPQPRVPKPCR